MDASEQVIIQESISLAQEAPMSVSYALADALESCAIEPWSYTRRMLLSQVPQPRVRARVDRFLSAWRAHAPDMEPKRVAWAIQVAASAIQQERQAQSTQLVWTGPIARGVALRRTDQALLDVIHAAQQRLLIVSFAVYKIPTITQALVQAARRGVALHICIEAPEPSGQRIAYDTIGALGPEVVQRAAIYLWPRDQRPTDAEGKYGSLHAKCAVADHHTLFISSANLTGYAMQLNMELGVLIQGGPLPQTVTTQFDQMIAQGMLRRVDSLPGQS